MAVGERRYFPLAETILENEEVLVGVFKENTDKSFKAMLYSVVLFFCCAFLSGNTFLTGSRNDFIDISTALLANFFAIVFVISLIVLIAYKKTKHFVSNRCIYTTAATLGSMFIGSGRRIITRKVPFSRVASFRKESNGVTARFLNGGELFLAIESGQHIIKAFEVYKQSNARK